ncbi:Ig-like domain-containing protein [Blautia obeum]|uniref:Ig-like domain-containing protein n=1 Tax=Blautia obeum TaxID=40520 RepID=UPI00319E88B9
MLKKIKSHLAILLMLALAFTLLIPAPVQAASKKKPVKVTVTSVKTSGTNKVVVKWRKAKYATNYRIYWKQAGTKKWRTLTTVKSNRTSYTHKSNSKAKLIGGKKYVYTVRAYNRYGRKWGAYNSKGKTVTIPAVPGKVNITQTNATSNRKVTITWDKTSNATSYRVFYKKSGAKKWITVANVSASKNSYTHSNNKKTPLAAGSKYVYTVRAYNKTSRKWGAYNTKGVVVTVPKKNAPVPTQPAKPTAVPTQKPKPTTPVIPSPSPEDTPDISGPTSTPTPAPAQPTATPAPVKVSSVTINPSTLKLTSKGQTAQLSASVLPNNAENKSIAWSTSNASVATVDNNGVVTAVANGNATITAAALDGSGKSGSCTVTVEITDESNQIVELTGGTSKILSIWNEDYTENIDVTQITFEYNSTSDIFSNLGYDIRTGVFNKMTIKAQRQGSCVVLAKYNGKILKKWTINVTSDWTEYIGYVNWRKQVESQIWTNGMSVKEKCDAAKNYIKTNFVYSTKTAAAVYAYNTCKGIDCFTATEFMGDFAKDAGAQMKYANNGSSQMFDYFADAKVAGGNHTFNMIFIDGQWIPCDACPTP